MGDSEGAEILEEVLAEGDEARKAEASTDGYVVILPDSAKSIRADS